jgi:hypothetical protein
MVTSSLVPIEQEARRTEVALRLYFAARLVPRAAVGLKIAQLARVGGAIASVTRLRLSLRSDADSR